MPNPVRGDKYLYSKNQYRLLDDHINQVTSFPDPTDTGVVSRPTATSKEFQIMRSPTIPCWLAGRESVPIHFSFISRKLQRMIQTPRLNLLSP